MLVVIEVDTLDQAIALVNANPFGTTQGKPHPQNQPTHGLLLEETVAVGEVALCKAEFTQLRLPRQSLQAE